MTLAATEFIRRGYSVLTINARHFGRIPGLSVIQL
jgi:predicted nucleic acid-binding protein